MRHLAPALLMAVAAWALPCAPARAGCGPHESRPTIALGWAEPPASTGLPVPRDRPPACSGASCSRASLPPILSTATPPHPLDICEGEPVVLLTDRQADARFGRPDALNPIGRVTEVERPPCRPGPGE